MSNRIPPAFSVVKVARRPISRYFFSAPRRVASSLNSRSFDRRTPLPSDISASPPFSVSRNIFDTVLRANTNDAFGFLGYLAGTTESTFTIGKMLANSSTCETRFNHFHRSARNRSIEARSTREIRSARFPCSPNSEENRASAMVEARSKGPSVRHDSGSSPEADIAQLETAGHVLRALLRFTSRKATDVLVTQTYRT